MAISSGGRRAFIDCMYKRSHAGVPEDAMPNSDCDHLAFHSISRCFTLILRSSFDPRSISLQSRTIFDRSLWLRWRTRSTIDEIERNRAQSKLDHRGKDPEGGFRSMLAGRIRKFVHRRIKGLGWASSISNATLNALFLRCLQGLSSPKRRWSRIDGWPIVKPQWWLSTYKRYNTRLPVGMEYAVETVPFSSTVRQCPHITLPHLSGPERATPIREYRAVFAVFMRTRYRGDALKAHSKGFVVFVLDTR